MGINSTEVSYSFGQLGSTFINNVNDDAKPPIGKVFVAITFLEDTTFDSTSGLIADNNARQGLEYVGTGTAAHDGADASARTVDQGSGGKAITDTVTFQAGLTIYGRWTTIDLASGAVIAYIGD
jgi:hypothetical protein